MPDILIYLTNGDGKPMTTVLFREYFVKKKREN